MKKEIIFKSIKISSVVISIFNLLMFFAMRCCWSGISKTLGYEKTYNQFILDLPIYVCVLFFLVCLANLILFVFLKKRNIWSIPFLFFDIVFLIVNMVIIDMGAKDYLYFIWPEFFKSVGILVLVLIAIFFIFYYQKTPLKESKVFKFSLISIILLASVAHLVKFSINSITYEPVVYAVEDTYQIVFSSSSDSLAWVKVGDKTYYQTNAGSQTSYTKIHKVIVPMEELNKEKEYSIHIQKLIYRGPFGGIKDKEISSSYSFRPVDSSDGFTYYSLSDIHMETNGSVKAASYNNEKEFLVINGDVISMVDSFSDANYVNKVAFEITKGEIPVVYARGNHELKGKYAEEFASFVGSKNGNFYYNFYLDKIYGIVLDIGEDHDDDYWEYYGTACYDDYRNEQLNFLNREIEEQNYKNYDYRLAVCHIPIVFVNSRKNHEAFKKECTTLLNNMDIDMSLCGHQHEIMVFEPNKVNPFETLTYNPDYKKGKYKGYLTDFNFPNLMISKRGYTQTDSSSLTISSQIGLSIKVDFINNKQICSYNNSKGELINVVNPFANIDYGNTIEIDLNTKLFA